MRNLLEKLWADEAGFVLSAELALVGTIAGVGLIAGMSEVRNSLIGEYDDVAESLAALDQSYSYGGFKGCKSFTAGSAYYEDGREVEIEFTEIYSEKPCVKPSPCVTPNVCPPLQHTIIEPLPAAELAAPCSSCGNEPITKCDSCSGRVDLQAEPSPQVVACPDAASHNPQVEGACESFVPAKVYRGIGQYGQNYQGVDGNPQKVIRPYEHSVYNVKRYIETPYFPNAPLSAPRSNVW